MSDYPICDGCGAEIICATPDTVPWSVTVRTPIGTMHDGGTFCGMCIVEFAKLGLKLYPGPCVHVLHEGRALCGMPGLPRDWPAGHKWTRIDEIKDATCNVCIHRLPTLKDFRP